MKFHWFILGMLVCAAPVLLAAESVPLAPQPPARNLSTEAEGPAAPPAAQPSDSSDPQIAAPPAQPVDASTLSAPAVTENAPGSREDTEGSVSETEPPSAGDFQSEIINSDPDIHEKEHAEGDDREDGGVAAEKEQSKNLTGGEGQQKSQSTETRAEKASAARLARERAAEAAAVKTARVPAEDPLFPTSPIIDRQIEFWIKIFTKYESNQGLIHDASFTMPIYAEVDMEGLSRRQQKRFLKRRKREIMRELKQLAKMQASGEMLDEAAQALLARLPKGITPEEIRELAEGVRFQRGMTDRFREGLVRSGAVLEEVKRILAAERVPHDLAYLPHVESSYNLRGYSKFGAAGIWQFTRGTGRKFLTIKYEVDERLDPLRSTQAAAKFLRQNFDRLGSWPLAITAYNHGPQGVERISRRRGTADLSTLISVCGCRRFKFASKNFYAEFLAARVVATNYKDYFGTVEMAPTLSFNEVAMPFYLEFAKAIEIMGIEEAHLRNLNPALRPPVIIGSKYIPKGYQLRVPTQVDPQQFVSSVPSGDRMKKQKLTEVALVRRGDTLYGLGIRHGVPWRVIARANNITAYHRIRPGQRLVIPRRGKLEAPRVGEAVATVEAPAPRQVATVEAPAPPQVAASATPPASMDNVQSVAERMAGESSDIAFQRAEGAYLFQNFDISAYDPESGRGVIKSAYGETLGHYANWAGVSTRTIRRHNLGYDGMLRPGDRLVIPLKGVSQETFSQERFEYHQGREEDFFSTYGVSEVIKVKVRRGDTVWNIAQSNNVPMWLFYQQNPRLLKDRVLAGMQVELPVIEALSELKAAGEVNPRQAAN